MAGVCPWPEDEEDRGAKDGFDCEERGCSSDLAVIRPGLPRAKTREAGVPRRKSWRRGGEAATSCSNRRGCIILERNWTCVAGEGAASSLATKTELVFVEVKTREASGLPSEAVTPKACALRRIAGYFLADYDGMECRVRST